MKRKIIFILLLIFSLALVGCKEPGKVPNPDEGNGSEEELKEFEETFNKIKAHFDETIPYIVTDDINLETEIKEYNAEIEWDTSNYDLIDYSGVVRPESFKAKEVTLTYKVYIGGNIKSGTKEVIVSPLTIKQIGDQFASQFNDMISRDYKVKTKYLGLFEIEWTTSNSDIFSNEGKYNKPDEDTEIEIKYRVSCKKFTSEEMSKTVIALGLSDLDKLNATKLWIRNEILKDLYFTELPILPTKYERFNISIEWSSNNQNIFIPNKLIKHYVYDRYFTLNAVYKLSNGLGEVDEFQCVISPLDTTKMTKKEILDNVLDSIAVENYKGVKFGYSSCPVLSNTFGDLYFYENKTSEVVQMICPVTNHNRGQVPMVPEIIVIHDTANYDKGSNAKKNATYCYNDPYDDLKKEYTEKSWHYTVGNDGIFQTIPDNECGGHANGSYSQKFKFLDSKIKATSIRPNAYQGEDGYIYINGIKSAIQVPDSNIKYADYGIITQVGENGNYYIAESWICNGQNSVKGGNGNGIGIETATDIGTDYFTTVRKLTVLVAELIEKYDLDLNRVVQHNTTSGKHCPQAIREANFWHTFKDYISLELFARANFSDCDFIWTSLSNNMDNTGAISLNVTNNEKLNYKVEVKQGNKVLTSKEYTTNIVK